MSPMSPCTMKTFPLPLVKVKGQHFASGARMPEGKGAFADWHFGKLASLQNEATLLILLF